jgi:nucleoside-diphosphate-sugar epimerase
VACGGFFTLNELLAKLKSILKADISAVYEEPRQGDIRHSFAAIDRLRSHGYNPTVSFDEGLERTVAYFAPSASVNRQPQ